jgi:hypothetical protein
LTGVEGTPEAGGGTARCGLGGETRRRVPNAGKAPSTALMFDRKPIGTAMIAATGDREATPATG